MVEPVRSLAELEKAVDRLLTKPGLSDHALLAELEPLAKHPRFGALTPRWGPALYQRNAVIFRPFVQAHFATFDLDGWRLKSIPWPAALEPWFRAVDAADDVALFRLLWSWKSGNDLAKWRKELVARYSAAPNAPVRRLVLEKMETYAPVDEPTAIALYRVDRAAADFIMAHGYRTKKREVWSELATLASAQGDEKLRWALYRRQVDDKKWAQDVRALAKELDGPKLIEALQLRHPDTAGDFATVFLELIELRGESVLPYLQQNIGRLRTYGSADRSAIQKLAKRALAEKWLEYWGALMRSVATQDEYLKTLKSLLLDRERPEDELISTLSMLAGTGGEWNGPGFGLAQVKPLDDETALLFYQRFPRLLAQKFRASLVGGWWLAYPKLVSHLVDRGDEDLLDYLASRFVTRVLSGAPKGTGDTVELLAAYYEGHKRTPLGFAQKASRVLGQVPAYTVGSYDAVIRHNRLARLLFERSVSVYLEDPIIVRDLLEAPEIHVQILALRALGLDDPRARALAAQNLDLLEPMLLRKLHRRTRSEAFRALVNSAQTPAIAARIVAKAKDAMALPDRRYPKEALVGVIGTLLARWPEARGAGETPVVYR